MIVETDHRAPRVKPHPTMSAVGICDNEESSLSPDRIGTQADPGLESKVAFSGTGSENYHSVPGSSRDAQSVCASCGGACHAIQKNKPVVFGRCYLWGFLPDGLPVLLAPPALPEPPPFPALAMMWYAYRVAISRANDGSSSKEVRSSRMPRRRHAGCCLRRAAECTLVTGCSTERWTALRQHHSSSEFGNVTLKKVRACMPTWSGR